MTSLFFPDFLITPLHVFSPFEYVSVAELHAVEKMHSYDTIRALLPEETGRPKTLSTDAHYTAHAAWCTPAK